MLPRTCVALSLSTVLALAVLACTASETPRQTELETQSLVSPRDPGALVDTTMHSTVGVVLDEIPEGDRARVAALLVAKPAAFWQDRAHRQINLTTYRLVFRQAFYKAKGDSSRQQLPIPPPAGQTVTLDGAPTRTTIDGHDVVAVAYTMTGTLLTDFDSPGISEPSLVNVNGKWKEPFTLPVDPELVLQRTGYACMDEAEFPPQSVDSEEVDSFYDDSCGVETALSQTGCHQTTLPSLSCRDALRAKIGHVDTFVQYVHLPWSAALADRARIGPTTTTTGSNLTPEASEFRVNRVIYRYIPPGDCALVEQCVGGTGWRRLLQFATADRNTGVTPVDIGAVDYFNSTDGGTPNSQHNAFEYSSCHHHYHFRHYGSFSYGPAPESNHKRGFCLQSTDRFSNNEYSPLHNPYADCGYQGIAVGWVDEYKAGLPCQWLDVTDVDTSKGSVDGPLTFVSNPDGFICEGNPVRDASGQPVWERTAFTTETGAPVDRMKCNFTPSWFADNTDSYTARVPRPGEGYVTAACPHDAIGPLRNCGFTPQPRVQSCAPGETVTLDCTVASGASAQVARVCEASSRLGTSLPCTWQDARANATVSGSATLSFACPAARGSDETGGLYSIYTAPVYNGDAPAAVTCTRR